MTVFLIATWVAFGIWTAKIGYQRGHPLAGVILGGVLPVVSVGLIWLFPRSKTHAHELPTAGEVICKAKRPAVASVSRGKHAA